MARRRIKRRRSRRNVNTPIPQATRNQRAGTRR